MEDGHSISHRSLEERPKSRRGNFCSETLAPGRPRVFLRPPSACAFPCPKTTASLLSDKSLHNTERLASQKGISFLRTSTSHGNHARAIRDKRYFEGVIQLKIGEISSELMKIRMEMEKSTREQSAIGIYEKRVKQLATELTDLQKTLAEYNTCIEKVNVGADSTTILCAAKDLARINDSDVLSLESLYTERVKKQESLKSLQGQIDKEIEQFEKIEKDMNPTERQQYLRIKSQRDDYAKKVMELESEIDHLNKSKNPILSQVFISPEKQEQIKLELKLYELEKTKDRVMEELKCNLSPEDQRKELLNRIKEDKAQTAAIQKATSDVKEQIKETELSLSQEDVFGKCSRQGKVMDLKNKEKGIEDFLSSVDKMMSNENDKLKTLQKNILDIIYQTEKKIAFIPTTVDYKSLYDSANSAGPKRSPSKEFLLANRYLVKLGIMKKNIEITNKRLYKEINTMLSDIDIFSDLVSLEEEFDTKRVWLLKEKAELCSDRPLTKSLWQDTLNCFNDLQKALAENDNYIAIANCEKKLLVVEESNFAIEEYLNEAIYGDDIAAWETRALEIVTRLNRQLIGKLSST
ncbi:intraflagellar transport protein 74 homolog [Cimex lectularius]|uniref:Uncharacterized protein n=1 Tax=Cimex lectularius TaxID=79782 RepID=A0A8I6TEC7_CIMLE|nr:intraflagellar transport protein 74 homolog [Cimex lectularius]